MRKLMIVTAVALFTSVGAAGESTNASADQRYKNHDLGQVEQAYVGCLKSDNAGVVESGIGHAINVKLLFPSMEFTALKKGIDALTRSGASASIRYRAYLASLVFENPGMFSTIEKKVYDDPGVLVSAVASKTHITLLGKGEDIYVRVD
jgi:hypothetical protein